MYITAMQRALYQQLRSALPFQVFFQLLFHVISVELTLDGGALQLSHWLSQAVVNSSNCIYNR
jgi:hypothetical protein